MIHGLKKGLALVLALALSMGMTAVPIMAVAESDFDPGTMYSTLRAEVFEGGRLIETVIKPKLTDYTPIPQAGEQYVKQMEAYRSMLEGMELRVTAVDDYDYKLYTLSLTMAGEEVVSARVRQDAESIRIVSNLLPGHTVNLPISSTQNIYNSDDPNLAALTDAYLTYFVVVGAWVSQKQTDTEDLYVYEPAELEETETRDAVSMVMKSRVRPSDMKELLRSFSDTLFDNEPLQQAITNLLAPVGVTRADVRRFADELPLIVSRELQATENPTEFTFSYDDDMGTVGFDGVMPAMFEPFPFANGSFTYSKKTGMDDTRHTAHGEMTFAKASKLTGDLTITTGEIIDETRRDEFSIALNYADPDEQPVVNMAIVQQDLYTITDNVDTLDTTAKFDVTFGKPDEGLSEPSGDTVHIESTVHSETKQAGELDVARSITTDLELAGYCTFSVQSDTLSKEYVRTEEWADVGEVWDFATMNAEQTQTAMGALQQIPMRMYMLIMAKLPPELLPRMF